MTVPSRGEWRAIRQSLRGRGWPVAALVTALLSLALLAVVLHAVAAYPWEHALRGGTVHAAAGPVDNASRILPPRAS